MTERDRLLASLGLGPAVPAEPAPRKPQAPRERRTPKKQLRREELAALEASVGPAIAGCRPRIEALLRRRIGDREWRTFLEWKPAETKETP